MTELEQTLTQRLEELEKKVGEIDRQRDEYHRLYLEAMERCRMLERGILASKSEKREPSDGQLALSVLGMDGYEDPRYEYLYDAMKDEAGSTLRNHDSGPKEGVHVRTSLMRSSRPNFLRVLNRRSRSWNADFASEASSAWGGAPRNRVSRGGAAGAAPYDKT